MSGFFRKIFMLRKENKLSFLSLTPIFLWRANRKNVTYLFAEVACHSCHEPNAWLWDMTKIHVRFVEQIVGLHVNVPAGQVVGDACIEDAIRLVLLYLPIRVGVGSGTVLHSVVDVHIQVFPDAQP